MGVCPTEILMRRGGVKYLETLRELARGNRNNQTETESLVWEKILRKKQTGFTFLRQKPFLRFVIDFYCSKLLLAIEIDGGSHIRREILDQKRDQYLQSCGIKTLRIDSLLVKNNIDEVKKIIIEEIDLRVSNLPFSKGETAEPRGI